MTDKEIQVELNRYKKEGLERDIDSVIVQLEGLVEEVKLIAGRDDHVAYKVERISHELVWKVANLGLHYLANRAGEFRAMETKLESWPEEDPE